VTYIVVLVNDAKQCSNADDEALSLSAALHMLPTVPATPNKCTVSLGVFAWFAGYCKTALNVEPC
jgi:hypothetical protein